MQYIDFMKAFDKVSHNCLIHKTAKHYGIDGIILGWISKSSLSNRSQEVNINQAKSLPAAVTSVYHEELCWDQSYLSSI